MVEETGPAPMYRPNYDAILPSVRIGMILRTNGIGVKYCKSSRNGRLSRSFAIESLFKGKLANRTRFRRKYA